MAYAIMRCQKLKNFGSFGGAVQHCFRERKTPNADENRTADNEHYYAQNEAQAFKKLRETLPDKVRKNGVICVEYVFTASPEFFDKADASQKSEFFNRSVAWLKEKYGEQNIVIATVHNDEKTPHMSAFVVPIDSKGKLNARALIGNREQMSRDQDSFHAKVADLGLERGIKHSKAKHQKIQQYYENLRSIDVDMQAVTAEEVKPKILKKNFFTETYEGESAIANRLNRRIKPMIAKAHEYVTLKQDNEVLEKSLKEKDECINDLNNDLTKLQQAFTNDLTQNQINALVQFANQERENNKRAKRAKELEEAKKRAERAEAEREADMSNSGGFHR